MFYPLEKTLKNLMFLALYSHILIASYLPLFPRSPTLIVLFMII